MPQTTTAINRHVPSISSKIILLEARFGVLLKELLLEAAALAALDVASR
jgi:hypothetical protein